MRPPAGRNVEIEGAMLPVGSSWASALAYCAFSFGLLWIALFVVRDSMFILIAGFFAAFGFAYLYSATRATLDARSFGAMRLRVAAPAAAVGGRFTGSLRISETAAVRGAVRAELRCEQIALDERREHGVETLWSEERSFPIRGGLGGSYAVIEFPIPAGLPPTEPPPLTGGLQPGRRYCRWELQAVAETDRAYRDELYAVIVQPAAGAVPAWASSDDALPIEIDRNIDATRPAAAAVAAKAPAFEVSRRLAPKPAAPTPEVPKARAPKPVEEVQELAETEVLPPEKPDRAALALLVAANLVPVLGVAFFGWKVATVVFLYWMENLVIGAFNVMRILAIEPAPGEAKPGEDWWPGKIALAAFFTVHYGGFCLGHGTVLVSFFGRTASGEERSIPGMVVYLLHDPVIAAALLAMVVSHGWSFFRNYIGRGEYQFGDASQLMTAPYKRIFVTHIFIIFGGLLLNMLKTQLPAMLLFIALKIGFDVHFHRAEHRRKSPP